jgi:hypothetical protein
MTNNLIKDINVNIAKLLLDYMKLEQKIEISPRLVQGLELELGFVPAFQLIGHLGKQTFSLNERSKEAVISTVNRWVNKFKTDRSLPCHVLRLQGFFSSVYCALNFLAPEWGINEELAETREKFIKDLAEDPYFMNEFGRPNALTLYFIHPEDGQKVLYSLEEHYNGRIGRLANQLAVIKGALGVSFSPVESEIGGPKIKIDRSIEQRCLRAANEFHYRYAASPPFSLQTQLDYLVRVLINPRMNGLFLTNPSIQEAKERYYFMALKNGSFVMPMPVVASSTKADFI